MIRSVERYSSAMRKKRVNLFGTSAFRIVALAFLLYLVVQHFFASTFRVESISMSPSLAPADRVIVSTISFGPRVPFSAARLPGVEDPKRGTLVVVEPPFAAAASPLARFFEPILGFLTFQKVGARRDSVGGRMSTLMVKRIIGIPGDTLRMRGFEAWIKPKGSSEFQPENRLLPIRFAARTSFALENWSSSLPFSGDYADIFLGADEYFVLGDNRPDSSDSRSWGPVSRSHLRGKIFFRYWPLRSFGRL